MFEWVNQFDLILLDFDGLLVNTETLHYLAYKKMVESLGFTFPIDYKTYCSGAHISTEELKNLIYTKCHGLFDAYPQWMKIREIKQTYYQKFLESGEVALLPGVENLIRSLNFYKKKACIVTNSPLVQIEIVEKKIPLLKQIPFRITRENYTYPKPNGDCYKVAIKLYGQEADRIIGFEDSTKGIEALKNAKVFSVEISPLYNSSIADKHFSSFEKVNFA